MLTMQPWNCWHFLEFCLRLFFELMGGLKDSFIEIFEKNGYENKNQNSYLDIWQYYDDYIMSSLSSTAHFLNMLSFSCPFKQKILVKFGKRSFSADWQLSKEQQHSLSNLLRSLYSWEESLRFFLTLIFTGGSTVLGGHISLRNFALISKSRQSE